MEDLWINVFLLNTDKIISDLIMYLNNEYYNDRNISINFLIYKKIIYKFSWTKHFQYIKITLDSEILFRLYNFFSKECLLLRLTLNKLEYRI